MSRINFWKKYSLNLFFGLANAALIIFLTLFFKGAVMQSINELFSLKEAIASLDRQEENFKGLNNNYQANLDIINNMGKAFVDADEPLDFLSLIETSSQELGLTAKIVPAISRKSKNEIWPAMVFQISCQGKPELIIALLEKLENSDYLAEITDLNLKRVKDEKNASFKIEAGFNLKVFVRSEDEI